MGTDRRATAVGALTLVHSRAELSRFRQGDHPRHPTKRIHFELEVHKCKPLDKGRVIWRGIIDPSNIKYPSSDGSESADGFPSFCPAGATSLKASKELGVGRTVGYMDVGGGFLYWAAGCIDAGIAAAQLAGAEANDDAEDKGRVDKVGQRYPGRC